MDEMQPYQYEGVGSRIVVFVFRGRSFGGEGKVRESKRRKSFMKEQRIVLKGIGLGYRPERGRPLCFGERRMRDRAFWA